MLTIWGVKTSFGQSKWSDNRWIQAEYQHGFILPEYSNLNYLINAPVRSVNLSLVRESTGKNEWERIYNYPTFGFNLLYSTLGNDEINGREVALYPFVRFKLLEQRKWGLFQQTGIGLSYVSRKFNLDENYLNITTGSKINIHFNFRVGSYFQLTNKLKLIASTNFEHFSNGNSMEPNLGLNSWCASLGLMYRIGTQTEKNQTALSDKQVKNRFELTYRIGGKRARALASDYFMTSSISFEMKRSVYRAFHVGIGLDGFFDSSTETEMIAAKSIPYKPVYDFQTGIHISQSLVYNKLTITFQEGIYAGLLYRVKRRPIYTRLVATYRISDHWAVNMTMKSHLHILDYPEIGFGYRW